MWVREILHKGTRLRVGKGDGILVHGSNWIPRLDTFRPISAFNLQAGAVVSELMDEEGRWNEDAVRSHFEVEHAEIILEIPQPRTAQENQMLWHFDKWGKYTANQIAMKLKFKESASCSEPSQNYWSIIWTLKLPEKNKSRFSLGELQRICSQVTTAENLWKRRIIQDPCCEHCGGRPESVSHVIFSCKFARKVWRLTGLAVTIQDMSSIEKKKILREWWLCVGNYGRRETF